MTTERPPTPAQNAEIAIQHHRAGRIAEAEALYRQVLEVEPAHFDALHLLGLATLQSGRPQEAIDLITRSLEIQPTSIHALRNLGEAYRRLKWLDEAEVCFERALRIDANFFEAHNSLGNVYQTRGQIEEAVACYRKAISINPDYADAQLNLGNTFQDRGFWNEALGYYETALRLRPEFAEAHFNLGVLFKAQSKIEEAIGSYQKALTFKPTFAEAHVALGCALQEVGDRDEAIACFQRALLLQPESPEAHWALALSQLAPVYGSDEVPEDFRKAFARCLNELDQWFDGDRIRDGFNAVGSQQPFHLVYHEENNRDLLARYGTLCRRLASHWQDEQRLAIRKRVHRSPTRVGIVSAHVCDHSVWTAITKGWCQHIDQRNFELHFFSMGATTDRATEFAQSRATSFLEGRKTPYQWADAILDKQIDILLYPELGMNGMTAKLANLRLAPVQATTWGQPQSSGLPTMDYYISAAGLEPENAQDHYTEQLVLLPNLGCSYTALEPDRRDVALRDLGLDTDTPLYICAGTPFKYVPEHDHVLVQIARNLGRCQFAFFGYAGQHLSKRLMQRLDVVFAQAGLDSTKFIKTLPWLNRAEFHSLMRQATALLDTIGFSGFNTAMQAIECGLPIITKEGRFMRGRFASGILRQIGVTELVADSDQAYVDLAVRFAGDNEMRLRLRDKISESRPILFGDVEPIRALEEFLLGAVKGLR